MVRRLWNLPWLRDRSQTERGGIVAVAAAVALGLITLETSQSFFRNPPRSALVGLVGVGATFYIAYIAYIVGMSNLVREVKSRDGERANFVGALTGLGMCGFIGISVIFVLAVDGPPFDWFQELGLSCSAMSLFCLGAMVSALPIVSYDAARAQHENPEE